MPRQVGIGIQAEHPFGIFDPASGGAILFQVNISIRAIGYKKIATEDNFVSSLAQQGAVQMRIEVNQTQQADRSQNLQQLISGQVDADMPSTIVQLNQAQTAYQASLQSAAKIVKLSLLDYIN